MKDPLESRVVKIRISTVKNAAIQNKVVVYFYLFHASMEHRIRDDLDPSPYLNMEESIYGSRGFQLESCWKRTFATGHYHLVDQTPQPDSLRHPPQNTHTHTHCGLSFCCSMLLKLQIHTGPWAPFRDIRWPSLSFLWIWQEFNPPFLPVDHLSNRYKLQAYVRGQIHIQDNEFPS